MALIDKLDAIGDAIREKTGTTAKLTLAQMPEAIRGIKGGGDADWGRYDFMMIDWTPTTNTGVFDFTKYMESPKIVLMFCPELYYDPGMGSDSDPNLFGVQQLYCDKRTEKLIGDGVNKDGMYNQMTVYNGFKYNKIEVASTSNPTNFFAAGKTYNVILIGYE